MPATEPNLRELLRTFCQEADSHNGVTGPTARALYSTIEDEERLLEAAKRLMVEINDDGITDKSLASARSALAEPSGMPQESETLASTPPAEDAPPSRPDQLAAQMDLMYLATQVRLMRDLQKQAEREGAVPASDIAKAAQGSGRIIDRLLEDILGPRDFVPDFQPDKG